MLKTLDREGVLEKAREGARIVEVLPRSAYQKLHLPGAINIPLEELSERHSELAADKPVIVYCFDFQ